MTKISHTYKDRIREEISRDGTLLEYTDKRFHNRDLVVLALKVSPQAWGHAHKRFHTEEFCIAMLNQGVLTAQTLPMEYCDANILEAWLENGEIGIEHIPEELHEEIDPTILREAWNNSTHEHKKRGAR